MEQDSFGLFLSIGTQEKFGGVEMPYRNILDYQEDNVPGNEGDLLVYSEPYGGPQNNPQGEGQFEHDPYMILQGERPETYPNGVPPEESPVCASSPTDERPLSLEATVPEDRNAVPPPIGDVDDFRAAAEKVGEDMTEEMRRKVDMVVKKAYSNGFACDSNVPHRMKVAFMEDLYGFDRVGSESLIHKASRELWTIKVEGDGSVFIEKQFQDDGSPVRV